MASYQKQVSMLSMYCILDLLACLYLCWNIHMNQRVVCVHVCSSMTVCFMYVLCMFYVCFMYVLCMLYRYVFFVYVLYMSCICFTYVLCMYLLCHYRPTFCLLSCETWFMPTQTFEWFSCRRLSTLLSSLATLITALFLKLKARHSLYHVSILVEHNSVAYYSCGR